MDLFIAWYLLKHKDNFTLLHLSFTYHAHNAVWNSRLCCYSAKCAYYYFLQWRLTEN